MLANAQKSTTAWCRLTSFWSANRLCLQMLPVWPSTENLPRSKQNSELFDLTWEQTKRAGISAGPFVLILLDPNLRRQC